MNQLSLSSFAAQLNTVFMVSLSQAEQPIELTLVEAANKGSNDKLEQFSLIFQGPPILLQQDTYSFVHQQLGELSIFIVPVGQNEAGFQYQAIFSVLLNHSLS